MNLLEFRDKYKFTQSELAKMLNIGQATVSRLEHLDNELLPPNIKQSFDKLVAIYEQRTVIDVKLDYLKVTFKFLTAEQIIEQILKLKFEFFYIDERMRNNYDYMMIFEDITVYSCFTDERLLSQGSMLELKGAGCRLMERILKDLHSDWLSFLRICLNRCHNITRLDIAIDDYVGYLDMPTLYQKYMKGEYMTTYRTTRHVAPKTHLADEIVDEGITLYFGSEKGKSCICMYEKGKELSKRLNIPIEDIEVVNRFELRFKDERAKQVVQMLVDGEDLVLFALGTLKKRVRFLEANNNEYVTYYFWDLFFKNIEVKELDSLKSATISQLYLKKRNYLRTVALKSIMILEKIDELNGTTVVQDMRDDIEFDDKDLKLIEWATNDLEYFIAEE